MSDLLFAWVGMADLKGPLEDSEAGSGPIAQAVLWRDFDEVHLLGNLPEESTAVYAAWLRGKARGKVIVHEALLSGPTRFGEIYERASAVVAGVIEGRRDGRLTFHLSPGTPAMAAVWIILGKTRFPAELIESSRDHGVRVADVPFDISADFLPDLLRAPDREVERLAAGLPPESPAFADILHRSKVMDEVILLARRVAPRTVPVLIEGESGTGKELLARAIHEAGPRRDGPFVAVNCGAIPENLIESELFGHKKGAFTGAGADRAGHFRAADGGTLFLDEAGELPPPAQVKLLRVLQEGEIVPVGESRPVRADVRIIAATNRNLLARVASGDFRSDLFYRLAVAVIPLPPLRERPGDVGLLIDRLLEKINRESAGEPGHEDKKLTASARNLLLHHSWPGNVRELTNTLLRAAIWTAGPRIGAEDVRRALLDSPGARAETVLDRPMGEGFNLSDLLADVARHYLRRALDEAGGNKTRAAELTGLPSYQTLTNWLRKYGIDSGI
ncbi:MAG: sigma 54-interacting transcriptional regulator [Candidatus Eisenbacteria bacterium]|nr:sigma 54-interacting transcriptional regulator [Candidatus Eisenbacteria bacterium]